MLIFRKIQIWNQNEIIEACDFVISQLSQGKLQLAINLIPLISEKSKRIELISNAIENAKDELKVSFSKMLLYEQLT